jgi:hypothetical protein
MVQGLYAENLGYLANYGIPQSGELGDRENFRISTSLEDRSSSSVTKARVLQKNSVTQTKLVTRG